MTDTSYPVCSPDDYAAADDASMTSSSTDEVGSAHGSCSADDEVASFVPCDVEFVSLIETQGSKEKVYEVKNGAFVEKPPAAASQRKISTTGDYGDERTTLMVTGDKAGAANPTKVEVMVKSDVGFCGQDDHSQIVVKSGGETLVSKKSESEEFEASRNAYGYELEDGGITKTLLSPYWPMSVSPKVYDVRANVCGIRNEGSVHGVKRMQVEVYPSDQYTLKLKVPPFKTTKHEVSATKSVKSTHGVREVETTKSKSKTTTTNFGDKEGTSQSSTTSSKGLTDTTTSSKTTTGSDGVVHTQSETTGTKGGETYVGESESLHFRDQNKVLTATESTEEAKNVVLSPAPPGGVTFEISRNGKVDSTAHNVQEILHTLKNLEYTFKEVFNTIKRVPSIGWKATLDVSFFSGDLYFSWGFREAKDWQVGYGFTLGSSLKIVDVTAAISFGAELSVATAKLEGSINGAVTLTGELGALLKAGDSTTDLSGKLEPKGTITVTFKGVAEVGVASYKLFEAEAGIQTGFVIVCEPKITKQDGLFLQYDIKFLPLTFYYQTKTATGYSKKEKYELTRQLQVAKGRFPEATKKDPAIQGKKTGLVAG